MKICNECGESKELSAFYPNKSCKQGVTGTCRSCSRIRINKWYNDNRAHRQEAANIRRKIKKLEIVKQFGDKCADCNKSFPHVCYDFHHLDRSIKDISIGKITSLSSERVQAELKKCVMLCANCHRIRHHGERKVGIA